MGKQGPCYHCGVTSTPLWRNGPPEKPVLCNACGSRWRTKGTLVNYTPLHARAEGEQIEIYDHKPPRMIIKGMSVNKKIPKRKPYQENLEFNNCFKKKKALDEEGSYRSSSGSVVSNSESCDQSNAWETSFPCKKRTCVGRPKAASSVEKLTKDLYSILQEQQSSCLTEEDLLFENDIPMLIGHGSVLMRDPHSVARDEESEASSLRMSSSLHSVKSNGKAINQNFSETRDVMRSPKNVMKIRSNHIETEENLENSVSSFQPMSSGESMVFGYEDNDISDQDILLDVPSNGSFPQAELLHMI